MQEYDPAKPLIYIHVPKTGGQSVRQIFQSWFHDRIRFHYFDAANGRLPDRIDLDSPENRQAPPLIYGHFNSERGFGIEQYYPGVRQFVTILRDPFDMHVSRFFYARGRMRAGQKIGVKIEVDTVAKHLESSPLVMLEHFPRPTTTENYRDILEEFFVEVGIFEDLQTSLNRIAAQLDLPPPGELPHLNARPERTAETLDVPPDARARFRDRFPLEHAVYDHARAMFRQASPLGVN
ncbi:sulfotransferase family protein [Seohaeicola saemankumensis]|nr:sulfotransferase family protein [Seohaeicola saemankumensis]MCA0873479.1 sulfotransferase family protein [Seohaeicola saemankumensis]